MKRNLRALLAAPLITTALLASVLVPQAAHADGTLAEYKWSSDSGFVEFPVCGFWITGSRDFWRIP